MIGATQDADEHSGTARADQALAKQGQTAMPLPHCEDVPLPESPALSVGEARSVLSEAPIPYSLAVISGDSKCEGVLALPGALDTSPVMGLVADRGPSPSAATPGSAASVASPEPATLEALVQVRALRCF